jgi:hypothetical protein
MKNVTTEDDRLLYDLPITISGTPGFIQIVRVPFEAEYIAVMNNTAATIYYCVGERTDRPADAKMVPPNANLSLAIPKTQAISVFWDGTVSAPNNQIVVQFSNLTIPIFGGQMNPAGSSAIELVREDVGLAKDGVDATGIAMPAGGSGIRGWLSGIYQKLANTLAVSVTNFPANQNVTVGNFPATQTVAGTVGVSNFPASQPVTGTVGVSNFPATQTVAGTVNTQQGTSSSLNLTAATVVKATAGRAVRVSVLVAGTAPGTVNDTTTTAGAALANEVFEIPNTVGMFELDWPCASGIVVVPGTGQTVAVSYV